MPAVQTIETLLSLKIETLACQSQHLLPFTSRSWADTHLHHKRQLDARPSQILFLLTQKLRRGVHAHAQHRTQRRLDRLRRRAIVPVRVLARWVRPESQKTGDGMNFILRDEDLTANRLSLRPLPFSC